MTRFFNLSLRTSAHTGVAIRTQNGGGIAKTPRNGGAHGPRPTGAMQGRKEGRAESPAPTKGTRNAPLIERRGGDTPPYESDARHDRKGVRRITAGRRGRRPLRVQDKECGVAGRCGHRPLRVRRKTVEKSGQKHGMWICEKKETPGGVSFLLCKSESYLPARALLASAISWKIPACFLATTALMTSRVATIRTIAMSRLMTTFWMIPARMKLTKETPATVRA